MKATGSNIIPTVTDYQGQVVDLVKFWESTDTEQQKKFGVLTEAVLHSISWAGEKHHVSRLKMAGYMERVDRFFQGVQLFQPFFVVGAKLFLDRWKISQHKWAIWFYAGAWAAFNVGVLFFRHCARIAQDLTEKSLLETGSSYRQKIWADRVKACLSTRAQEINDLLGRYGYQKPDVLIPQEDKLHECWNEDMFTAWELGDSFTNLDSVSPVAISTDVCKTPYLTLRIRLKNGCEDSCFVTLYPIIPGVNDQNDDLSSTKEVYKLLVSDESVRTSVMGLRDNIGMSSEKEHILSNFDIVEDILKGCHARVELDTKRSI